MSLLKGLLVIFGFVFLTNISLANDNEMMKMLKSGAFDIDKTQVNMMLDELVKAGRISKDQAEAAKKELNQMNDQDLGKLKEKAVDAFKTGKAKELVNRDYRKGASNSPIQMSEEQKKAAKKGAAKVIQSVESAPKAKPKKKKTPVEKE